MEIRGMMKRKKMKSSCRMGITCKKTMVGEILMRTDEKRNVGQGHSKCEEEG
jgi:hypothetical protein